MRRLPAQKLVCALLFLMVSPSAHAVTVSARVDLIEGGKAVKDHQAGEAVFWLTPIGTPLPPLPPARPDAPRPRLTQHNKSFEPHVLVVPVGSVVEFPNRDPFFHNVFSLFEGKRFDLGLYEAGSMRTVRFDKPGISYIFCNIHAEMSAVVIALTTPYYGISNQRGELLIPNVPSGRYTLHVWYETALPQGSDTETHEVTVSGSNSFIGVFRIPATNLTLEHKNKYGGDYEPPTPDNPAYPRP